MEASPEIQLVLIIELSSLRLVQVPGHIPGKAGEITTLYLTKGHGALENLDCILF